MSTILLKILILRHLQILHDHRHGPPPGSRDHPLANPLGEGHERSWGRVTDHDVHPYLVRADDHPGHLLPRAVGSGLDVAAGAQSVNSISGKDCLGHGSCQLQVVVQSEPRLPFFRLLGVYLTLCSCSASLCCSSWRCCCSCSCWRSISGKNTSLTEMLTSVTLRPTRLSTRLTMFRRTASATCGMD